MSNFFQLRVKPATKRFTVIITGNALNKGGSSTVQDSTRLDYWDARFATCILHIGSYQRIIITYTVGWVNLYQKLKNKVCRKVISQN